jgi:hypothetical protein
VTASAIRLFPIARLSVNGDAAWSNPRHNPTQATLNRLLKPFCLRLSLAPIPDRTGKRAD